MWARVREEAAVTLKFPCWGCREVSQDRTKVTLCFHILSLQWQWFKWKYFIYIWRYKNGFKGEVSGSGWGSCKYKMPGICFPLMKKCSCLPWFYWDELMSSEWAALAPRSRGLCAQDLGGHPGYCGETLLALTSWSRDFLSILTWTMGVVCFPRLLEDDVTCDTCKEPV